MTQGKPPLVGWCAHNTAAEGERAEHLGAHTVHGSTGITVEAGGLRDAGATTFLSASILRLSEYHDPVMLINKGLHSQWGRGDQE